MTNATSAPLSAPLPPTPLAAKPVLGRVVVIFTALVAGAAGCLIAYWTWRMVLKLPLGLDADLRLASTTAASNAPGMHWWVPTVIAGGIAVLLWTILAAHARRISLVGGSAAIVLVSILIFPVAAICIELGGLSRDGWPPVFELIGAMPRVLVDAVKVTFVNLLYCGLITVPAAALIGLLLAATGRLVVSTVERTRSRAEPNAE
jgi:hypothetical protein